MPKQIVTQTGLDSPVSGRYMATLAGASSLWTELQTLLNHNISDLPSPAIRALVIDQNVLAKRTLPNRKEVWKKLTERYSLSYESPLFRHFLAAYNAETSAAQRGLLGYLLLCANDALMRRLSLDWLSPRLTRSGIALKTEEVEAGLLVLAKEIPAIAAWTPSTRLHISQHFLGAIRDFGLAEGRILKRTQRPHAGSRVLVYAIQLALLDGLQPLEVLESVWIRLLGIDMDTAITRMYQLNAEGYVKFRMSGSVVELTVIEDERRL